MIKLAKTAGFCYGVDRAVKLAETEAEKSGKLYTLGPIIHNPHVVSDLEKKGALVANDVSEIPENSRVVIRSHGLPKSDFDILNQKKCKIIDATCPFVKKIHNIVQEYYEKGYTILVIGDETHPEVKGILGWCGEALVISDEDAVDLLKLGDKPLCVVSQTTFERKKWEKIKNKILKLGITCDIIDTICNATAKRQAEIEEIARKSDAVIVIGGRQSSNTKRLAHVAKKHCEKVFLIECAEEIKNEDFSAYSSIGVTAGASTPACIIKEVIHMVEEKTTINFEEELENSKLANIGDTVKGTVIKISPTEVTVAIPYEKMDGIIPASEVTADPTADISTILSVGQEIEAFVYRKNDIEGYIGLSMRKLESLAGQKQIEEAYENGTPITAKIVEVVKGGVIAYAFGSKVFIPASQASERFTDDLDSLLGTDATFKIINYDRRRRKIVGSVKTLAVAARREKAEAFWATAEVGQKIKGVVKSVTNFGAFVDIGGVDGLVHVTELSWLHIKNPAEIVKPGDIMEVVILALDKENNKISLGHKSLEENPWTKAQEMIKLDDVIKCKIVRIVPFGAFAEIIPGVDGLIHISQIANRHIAKPEDVLAVGQEVEAKVVEANWDAQKIGLSIRALEEPVAEENVAEEVAVEEATEEVATEE